MKLIITIFCITVFHTINVVVSLEKDSFKDEVITKQLSSENLIYTNKENFDCPIIAPSENVTSVHELKISDIKAVAALGDSLSAGTAADAESVYKILTDYRDTSFSAGGGESLETLVTVPNILKKYNKNLIGYSTGNNAFYRKTKGHFNMATGANRADHIPDRARNLVERIKNSKDLDYKNDWKLITLFVGGNDLCEYCLDKKSRSTKSYINFIKKA